MGRKRKLKMRLVYFWKPPFCVCVCVCKHNKSSLCILESYSPVSRPSPPAWPTCIPLFFHLFFCLYFFKTENMVKRNDKARVKPTVGFSILFISKGCWQVRIAYGISGIRSFLWFPSLYFYWDFQYSVCGTHEEFLLIRHSLELFVQGL